MKRCLLCVKRRGLHSREAKQIGPWQSRNTIPFEPQVLIRRRFSKIARLVRQLRISASGRLRVWALACTGQRPLTNIRCPQI